MGNRRKKAAVAFSLGAAVSVCAAYAAGTASVKTVITPSDYEEVWAFLPPSQWGFSPASGEIGLECECVRVPDGRLTSGIPTRHGIYEVYHVSKNAPRWRCPDEETPCRLRL